MDDRATTLSKIELMPLIEKLVRKFELPDNYDYAKGFLSDELYLSIINASGFKRLFKIPFMGGLAYLDSNCVRESRGHHSLAVGLLAYYYSKINSFNKRDERLWVLSGLLHDIHHLPFSHTMEYALKGEISSFSVHDFDLKIIFENNANEKNESIGDIVRRYDIEIENELFPFISKDARPDFYNSSHNIDTLEGITRVFQNKYCLKSSDSLPKKIIEANAIYDADKQGAEMLYDSFWGLKDMAYFLEIYDGKKVFFERILSYYLFYLCEKNGLLDKIHQLTDEDFFDSFPKLRSIISNLWLWIDDNCYSRNRNEEMKVDCNQLWRSLETRRFNTNTETKHIELDDVDSLKRRYEVVKTLSTISFDANSLDKLEKIVELPVDKLLDKISYEWVGDEQNGSLELHSRAY